MERVDGLYKVISVCNVDALDINREYIKPKIRSGMLENCSVLNTELFFESSEIC